MKTATPTTDAVETASDIRINVLFKKMQKDDKKEILMFHILADETKFATELLRLTGKMTILTLSVDGADYDSIQAEFVNIQRDSKKTVLKFNVATEDEERVNAIYPAAGTTVDLIIQPQQMTIDDVPPEKGIEYSVNNGLVEIEKKICDYCNNEIEDGEELTFVETFDFTGHVCDECKTHEIKK